MSTGRLLAGGSVAKWVSMAWKPASMAANPLGPIAIMVDSPIAASMEYRPPTQSQKPNILARSMPNAWTSSEFVDTATKCLATAFSPRAATSHERAACPLVIVSKVEKVLDAMTNKVRAGSRSQIASLKSVGSTFETKRNVISRFE